MTSMDRVSWMWHKRTILDGRRSRRSVMSDVWVRIWSLAVEVERYTMGLHALDLRWTAVFVVAAVVIGTTVEVTRTFVLVGAAMLSTG